jgi:uncharacterized protein YqeY
MLLEKINQDFKKALSEKDEVKVSTLRMLKTAIHNLEIELRPKKKELTDELILEVISREIKRRKEAIEAYEKGNRLDLAEKEKKELEILSLYLPEQLSDDKIREIVRAKIAELGASSPQDFGKVMGVVTKETKGKAEGSKVAAIVKEELNKNQK